MDDYWAVHDPPGPRPERYPTSLAIVLDAPRYPSGVVPETVAAPSSRTRLRLMENRFELSASRSTSRLKVLIVDDSVDGRLLMRAFLQRAVETLDEAPDGAAALAMVRSAKYDLVLMDMHMPVMDGLAATRAIRELEAQRADGHRVRILALTADDGAEDRQRSLDAGCDDHLVKPVSRKALLAALAPGDRATDEDAGAS